MWCKSLLIAFLGTTTPAHVVSVPAAKVAYYREKFGDAAIESAKQCADDNKVRWRIVGWKRRK